MFPAEFIPRVRTAQSHSRLVYNLLRNCQTVPMWPYLSTVPSARSENPGFSASVPSGLE